MIKILFSKFNLIKFFFASALLCILIYYFSKSHVSESHAQKLKYEMDKLFQEPIIFVGGYVSSGTTLMRAILDVHPDVKCGPELKVTIETYEAMSKVLQIKQVRSFLNLAKIKLESVDRAIGLFSFYLFLLNVPNANRICNKEPYSSKYITFYKSVFPNSKFIYMLRDGREVAFSVLTRWHDKDYSFESFYKYLNYWNEWNKDAFEKCKKAGSDYCKVIRYENLVQEPKKYIDEIAEFLNLKWTDKFLKHQEFLNKDVKLTRKEPSWYGIKKEINNKSLNNWIGKIKDYDEQKVNENIQMLKEFGYL